ncbi:coiled-coil domain-containing protein [Clostridium senegalense]
MDTTFSVRISDELKEKFNDLAQKQGINNKEFMETMVKFYELNSIKDDNFSINDDIKELQNITGRIVDIFINSTERNKIKFQEVTNLNKEANVLKEEEINNLKKEIATLKEENNKLKELNKEIDKRDKKISSLEGDLNQLKNFNVMLEEKNKDMDKSLYEFKSIKEVDEKKNKLINDLEKEILTLKNHLKEKELKVENLEEKLTILQNNYKKEVEELTNKNIYLSEMELEKIKLEYERKMLTLEEGYKERLSSKETELNNKIMHLMEKREEDGEVIRKLIMGTQKNNEK